MFPPNVNRPMPHAGMAVPRQQVQPTGIATLPTNLQGYVNPNIKGMPHRGMPLITPTRETKQESNYEALPEEIKEKVEELQKIASKKKKKKKEPVKMGSGGDSQFEMIKQSLKDSPYKTAIALSSLGSDGVDILSQLLGLLPFKKGGDVKKKKKGYAKKQRKRKHYMASGFVKMKKKKKYIT